MRKKREWMRTAMAGLACVLGASFGHAGLGSLNVRVPYADKAPVLDGVMAPGEWDAAAAFPTGGFYCSIFQVINLRL